MQTNGHTPTEIVAKMIAVRRGIGMTQEQLAHKMGVTQETISHWETGRKSPRAVSLERWAAALGLEWGLYQRVI